MKGRAVLFVLCFGFLSEGRCQELYLSVADRCSIPLNGPPQRSFHFGVIYTDSAWVIDWLRVDHAPTFLFTTIDQITVQDRTNSFGLGGGKCIRMNRRLELRMGFQLRYHIIHRSVDTGFSSYGGSFYAQAVGCEIPVWLSWRVWSAWPLHLFIEGTPGYAGVIGQSTYDRPDPSMKVRSSPSLAVSAGLMYQF